MTFQDWARARKQLEKRLKKSRKLVEKKTAAKDDSIFTEILENQHAIMEMLLTGDYNESH